MGLPKPLWICGVLKNVIYGHSVSVSVCGYVYMYANAHGGQKRASDSLEFQVVVSVWVLGTGLRSSGRGARSSPLEEGQAGQP